MGRVKKVLSDETMKKEVARVNSLSRRKIDAAVKSVQDKVQEKRDAGKRNAYIEIPLEVLIHFCQSGMSQRAIARSLGVAEMTVHNAFAKHGLDWQRLKAFRDTKAEVLNLKQMQLLEKMTVEKMEAASLRDQATTLNILNNAEKIERGQATKIMNVRILTDQLSELDAEEARLRKLLEMAEDITPVEVEDE